MLRLGDGCEVDLKKSFDYYTRAAEKGDDDAKESLSFFKRDGGEVSIDYEMMFQLAKIGADEGCIDSMSSLAQHYRQGKGCEIDLIEAVVWYEKYKKEKKKMRNKKNKKAKLKETEVDESKSTAKDASDSTVKEEL